MACAVCATLIVTCAFAGIEPAYVNHNKVRGDAKTMTNMVEWAASVKTNIADAADALVDATNETLKAANAAARAAVYADAPALTEDQVANGVTYVKGGHLQDAAIAIGRDARAALPSNTVANATKGNVLRSVSVAIGGFAEASYESSTYQNQAIAIGYCSKAKDGQAIAIGSGAQHDYETDIESGATVALANQSVAIGYAAKATAQGAWQFGSGSNTNKNSLKFGDVYIVKDNKLAVPEQEEPEIDETKVQQIVDDALAPQVYDLDVGLVVTAKTHAIVSIVPKQQVDEFEVFATQSRNYEVYYPNTEKLRMSLPGSFGLVPSDGLTVLGLSNTITRLPALVKVREPIDKQVIVEVVTYDDGYDWTPIRTGERWSVGESGRSLETVYGTNLQSTASVSVEYETTNGVKATKTAGKITPLYSLVYVEGLYIDDGASNAVYDVILE